MRCSLLASLSQGLVARRYRTHRSRRRSQNHQWAGLRAVILVDADHRALGIGDGIGAQDAGGAEYPAVASRDRLLGIEAKGCHMGDRAVDWQRNTGHVW